MSSHPTAAEIRRTFLDYFTERGHREVPSGPVCPPDDPTLLFTNAGMNQFKDVFLGTGRRDYSRAADTQKCIRVSGKHNDLEEVGRDTYHHTFFEMLGNWSFGDYFKEESIEWAWTLLTEVWGLDPERLHVTVFGGDEGDGLQPDLEAETIWKKFVPEERIQRFDKKDNFWEMGETGPCGPCSEIHYDFTPDKSGAPFVNGDSESVIEIWNLVFIQFNRNQDGSLEILPAKHVDTGMGFERITRVLQGKSSNYDTDIWTPIFEAIQQLTGAPEYAGSDDDPRDIAYRIIADHIRALTFAITDGAPPSSDGRGYVLRRILRRAVRHARQTLGVTEPMLCRLVPVVADTLGDAFPELKQKSDAVAMIVRDEEESFLRTLDRGIALFEDAAERAREAGGTAISGTDAFALHDTYGFPIDLTRVMAEECGMTVDEAGYEQAMSAARERSRAGGSDEQRMSLTPNAIDNLSQRGIQPTDDIDKYHGRPLSAKVEAIWNGTDFDEQAEVGRDVAVILNRTNFYAEAGGQVSDTGEIRADVMHAGQASVRGFAGRRERGDGSFRVEDVVNAGGYMLHTGRVVDGTLRVGDDVTVTIDRDRRQATQAHHTSTHLLNHALRTVLGDGVDQRGSLVAPDRLRFDFSHTQAMSDDEVERVEQLVRTAIEQNLSVNAQLVALDDAQQINGLRAVFGERYPDPVRVVSVGASVDDLLKDPGNAAWVGQSTEFCGGTHLTATGDAGAFVLLSEGGLAAGVRRISALAGTPARAAIMAADNLATKLDEAEQVPDAELVDAFDHVSGVFDNLAISAVDRARLGARLDGLRDRVKQVRKAHAADARSGIVDQARTLAEEHTGAVLVASLLGADKETLRDAVDVIRSKCPESAALLFAPDEIEGKVAIIAIVPKPLIAQGLKAGDWVRTAATLCGGGGGGRPDMAQAGGKDPSQVDAAIVACRAFAAEKLGLEVT